jgi:urease accessory protein
MTNLRKGEGLDRIVGFIEAKGGLSPKAKDEAKTRAKTKAEAKAGAKAKAG